MRFLIFCTALWFFSFNTCYAGTNLGGISKAIKYESMDEYMQKERERAEKALKELKGASVYSYSETIE